MLSSTHGFGLHLGESEGSSMESLLVYVGGRIQLLKNNARQKNV